MLYFGGRDSLALDSFQAGIRSQLDRGQQQPVAEEPIASGRELFGAGAGLEREAAQQQRTRRKN